MGWASTAGLAGLLLPLTALPGLADLYCSRFDTALQPGTLYVATCTEAACLSVAGMPNGGDAVLRTDANGPRQLVRRSTYTFIYKTERQPTIRRSLVAVQIKHSGIPGSRGGPSDVRLARDRIPFGCDSGSRVRPQPEWPQGYASEGEFIPDENLASVRYRRYDEFHRLPRSSSDDFRTLNQGFHTNYHNGSECVATLSDDRRGHFLMTDRDKIVRGRATRFLARFGLVGTAIGDETEVARIQNMRVVLQNYESGRDQTGCLSFKARVEGSGLDISLSDLERNTISGAPIELKTWSFTAR